MICDIWGEPPKYTDSKKLVNAYDQVSLNLLRFMGNALPILHVAHFTNLD